MRRTLISILGALLLVLVLTVAVRADTQPVMLYACVNNSSGTIHMISATDSCASNEQLVVWNQQGPAGPQGLQGSAGPVGPQGPQGAQGPTGANGVSGYQVVTRVYTSNLNVGDASFFADCASGTKALGGGYQFFAGAINPADSGWITTSAPLGSDGVQGDGWEVTVHGGPALFTSAPLTVYAICASV